jgi:rhodanese-related sulfurtransferase
VSIKRACFVSLVVEELEPAEVEEKLRTDPEVYLLLDVREEDEREAARIEPSVHIPMNEVPSRLHDLPTDRRIIIYCHHGSRSAMVAGYLEAQGFDRVANLTGGIEAWSLTVDRKVPRY